VSIWITGVGLVTALGADTESTWTRLVRGERGIRTVTLFDTSAQRVGIAAQVEGVRVPEGAQWSRTSAMALAAATEAMRGARVDPRTARVGLVVASTTGGMFETERLLARLHAEPERREVHAELLSHPLTATGDRLEERLGPFARVRTVSSACSSGANALVVGALWLLAGEVDAVVAGGADGLCRLTLSGFNALGAIDPEPCRPFDERRRGMSLGEGAGFVVLERAWSAEARGATPIAALAGWAMGAEGHHITNPEPGGTHVASLLSRAMARAGLTPGEIDYVNAHGTGTALNDPMEAAALSRALGDEVRRIPVSSSKGQLGHTLGAAGAIEAAITALAIARRTLVPTGGLERPEAALGLTHVMGAARRVDRVRAAISNAFGFGGMDTVLVLREANAGGATSRPPAASSEASRACVTGIAVVGSTGLVTGGACADLAEPTDRPGRRFDPDARLDEARARRLDRPARLGAVAVGEALRDAGAVGLPAGAVLGSAYGNVDACAAFVHRILERGARFASPADFPNLVPSSPVGHASIYLALHGPTFATADLSTSGESAFVQAVQLVESGDAERIAAGALEPASGIVERAMPSMSLAAATSAASAPPAAAGARTDVAAALVVETLEAARLRGARVLARVARVHEWRGDAPAASFGPPRVAAEAVVVLARADPSADALLDRTPWASCARVVCAPPLGESDGLGAVALAVAVARIGARRSREALVVGLTPQRGYAILLVEP
jgi:3-oxoacyl-[acyl-carrier-protein] synthase II